jgi:hypothetical protein
MEESYMQPTEAPLSRRNLLFIIGAVLLLVVILILTFASSFGKETVTISSSPADAAITMDGKKIKTGTHKISKGKHKLVATRDHFTQLTVDIDTNELRGTKTVYLIMIASDDEGRAYIDSHPEEQDMRERAGNSEFSNVQETLMEKYPVLADLPHETNSYKVDYEVTDDKTAAVTFIITTYVYTALPGTTVYTQQMNAAKSAALDYLRGKKLDPNKLTIEYAEVSGEDTSTPEPTQEEVNNRQ